MEAVRQVVLGTSRGGVRIRDALTLRHPAWITIGASLALSLVGIYAIDVALRSDVSGGGIGSTAMRQGVFLCIGLAGCVAAALVSPRVLMVVAWPAYAVLLGLLVFLLAPGVPTWLVTPRNGARGWINLGVSDFQPSEFMKIAFALVVGVYLRYARSHRQFLGLVKPGLIAAVPIGLITLQPDLGTASLFAPALLLMLLAAGARIRHLVIIVLAAALAAPAAYPFLQPHQKERIAAIIKLSQGDSSANLSSNYQSVTARRVTGAGQAAGMSDAHARSLIRFNRLPERHNDMIFSVVVARFGFLGGVGVLALYGVWLGGAVLTAAVSRDPFGRLVVIGLAAFVATQVVINVGMTLGLLPIIGITLPYLSYGGSSLLTSWLMTGVIAGVAMRRPLPPIRPSFQYADDDA